jgi:hypothetical protein
MTTTNSQIEGKNTMLAFNGTLSKNEFVTELKKHQALDAFTKGLYWEDGKGCAVGCSIKSISDLKKIKIKKDDHSAYEEHLGVPEWMARLQDTLFEGMSLEKSKSWPVDFAEAINEGADLEKVKTPFVIMILEHSIISLDKTQFDAEQWPQVKAAIDGSRSAIQQMIEAQKSGDEKLIETAESAAESAARSAAWSAAWSAAESAAWSAASAA